MGICTSTFCPSRSAKVGSTSRACDTNAVISSPYGSPVSSGSTTDESSRTPEIISKEDFNAAREAVRIASISLKVGNHLPPMAYQYQPLHSEHIRLLSITFSQEGSIPQLELTHVPLAKARFQALSYCWGDGEREYRVPVRVDGAQEQPYVKVTKNLLGCLLHISRLLDINETIVPKPDENTLGINGRKYIWIDQLCINQDPENEEQTKEKAAQLGLMGEIYKTAERVLVWLGCDLDYEQSESLVRFSETSPEDLSTYRAILNNANDNSAIVTAIRHIWTNPWFQRSWIVQEASLAKHCSVVIGLHSFPRGTLAKITACAFLSPETERIYGTVKYLAMHIAALSIWDECFGMRPDNNTSTLLDQGRHLLQFMTSSRYLEAGDARDKVMAYFYLWKHLATNFDSERDYEARAFPDEARVSSVYAKMAAALVHDTKSLDILGAHETGSHVTTHGRGDKVRVHCDYLPSWVPNWDSAIRDRRCSPVIANMTREASGVEWNASKGRQHLGSLPVPTNYELYTRGKILHSVKKLYPSLEDGKNGLTVFQASLRCSTQEAEIPLREAVKMVLSFRTLKKEVDEQERVVNETIEALQNAQMRGQAAVLSMRDAVTMRLQDLDREPEQNADGSPHENVSEVQEALSLARELDRQDGTIEALRKWTIARQTADGRRFARVALEDQSKIGLVPYNTNLGDVIAILHGCRFPVVLRKHIELVRYTLVGDCYIQGMMFGEAVTWEEDEADDIVLV